MDEAAEKAWEEISNSSSDRISIFEKWTELLGAEIQCCVSGKTFNSDTSAIENILGKVVDLEETANVKSLYLVPIEPDVTWKPLNTALPRSSCKIRHQILNPYLFPGRCRRQLLSYFGDFDRSLSVLNKYYPDSVSELNKNKKEKKSDRPTPDASRFLSTHSARVQGGIQKSDFLVPNLNDDGSFLCAVAGQSIDDVDDVLQKDVAEKNSIEEQITITNTKYLSYGGQYSNAPLKEKSELKNSFIQKLVTEDPLKPSLLIDERAQKKDKKKKRSLCLANWFGMGRKEITNELSREVQAIELRTVADPKAFYRGLAHSTALTDELAKQGGLFCEFGTVLEGGIETTAVGEDTPLHKKRKNKKSLVSELLTGIDTLEYVDKKSSEIEGKEQSGNQQWYKSQREKRRKKN